MLAFRRDPSWHRLLGQPQHDLYIGGSEVVEAVGEGVVRRPLEAALRDASLAIALRRRNLTDTQRAAVVAQATQFALKKLPYDKVGAAGAGVNTGRGQALAAFGCAISLEFCALGTAGVTNNAKPENADGAFFCSELVARVFELAGAPVVEGSASFAAPRHIRMATSLLYLGKLKDTPRPDAGIAPGSPL
jgi:hypothetical protein